MVCMVWEYSPGLHVSISYTNTDLLSTYYSQLLLIYKILEKVNSDRSLIKIFLANSNFLITEKTANKK
jgi:hypothetical protein